MLGVPERRLLWRLGGLVGPLLLTQSIFILYSRHGDWFFLDDFLGFIVARESGLTWHYIRHDVFGQFAPGYRLLDYLYFQSLGLNYTGVRLFDVVTMASMTISLTLLMRRWRSPLARGGLALALVPYSPIFSVIFQWFSAALHVLPATGFILVSLVILARPAALTWRHRCAAAAFYAAALMFYAKMLFASILFLGLRLAVTTATAPRVSRAIMQALVDILPCVPVAALYLTIVVTGGYHSGTPPTSIGCVLEFLRIGLLNGFACNMFGFDAALPGRQAVAMIALLTPIILLCWKNPNLAWLWVAFCIQFALALAAIAWGRVVGFGPQLAALSRYHCDSAVLYAACLIISTGAFWRRPAQQASNAAGQPTEGLSGRLGIVAVLAFAAYLSGASLRQPLLYENDNGTIAHYVQHLHATMEAVPVDVPIEDVTLPDWLMPGWMAPHNHLSDFILLFKSAHAFTDARNAGVTIDANGQIAGPWRLAPPAASH